MIKQSIQRVVSYGLIYYLAYRACVYFSPEVLGLAYSKIIGVFAVVSGLVQSLSFTLFSKISSVYSTNNMTRWSRNILDHNISRRRELLKHRFFFGMFGSLAIGVFAAIGFLNKDAVISNELLAIAITLILAVIISMVISFMEFFSLDKLGHELSEKSRIIEQKQKFLNNGEADQTH